MGKLTRLIFFLNDIQELKGEIDYNNAGIFFHTETELLVEIKLVF